MEQAGKVVDFSAEEWPLATKLTALTDAGANNKIISLQWSTLWLNS